MTDPRIRPAEPTDAEAIDAIHWAAFPTDAEARLVALLIQRGKAVVSLVAEEAGQVVGHVLVCRGRRQPPGVDRRNPITEDRRPGAV